MRILFVCTGNTCRSPMAAFLAQQKIRERKLDWKAESAGLYAIEGQSITKPAASALQEHAVEVTDHKSRSITDNLITDSDVIFTMTASHAWELRRRYPQYAGKIQALGAFVQDIASEPDPQYDIVDPYGGSDEQYRVTADELSRMIDIVFNRLTQSPRPN